MTAALEQPIAGLYATATAPLPYLAGVVVRSFVLQRGTESTIIYNSPGIDAAAEEIRSLGEPSQLLINHWHEAMYGPPQLEVPVWVHQDDRAHTEPALPVNGTFTGRRWAGEDLEVIPTPGHTAGVTTFLWDSGEHRFLFSGDSIWVQGGEWKAVVLGDSNRTDYLASLDLMRELDFDVLVPWGAETGAPCFDVVTRSQARQRIEAIIARVEAGSNE